MVLDHDGADHVDVANAADDRQAHDQQQARHPAPVLAEGDRRPDAAHLV